MSELIDTFTNRLKTAMRIRNMKAVELSNITGIAKSSLSDYINGKYEAKQDGVFLLAKALNVSEAWLMGADVPMERDNFRFASYGGIDVNGLTEEDIKEINDFVNFIKNRKKED